MVGPFGFEGSEALEFGARDARMGEADAEMHQGFRIQAEGGEGFG